MKDNEILWEQTLEAGSAWIFMGMEITFFIFVLMATIYNLSQMYKNGIRLDNDFFLELVEIGLYHLLYIYTKVNQLFVASTLQYQVTSNTLIYNWGIKKNTSVKIPCFGCNGY